jgi:D-alanyl-D-alanine carboxypeptidase
MIASAGGPGARLGALVGIAVALVACGGQRPGGAARDHERRARLQAVLDGYVRGAIPGATLAAAFPDGGVVSRAAGFADPQARSAMRADDRMLAGSVGKTFFAAVLLQLAGEGRVALDEPIQTYLRAAPWIAKLPAADRVTARMLLEHTSGYPAFDEPFMRALIDEPRRDRTHEERLRPLFDQSPLAAPGAKFAYTDLNYVLVAEIIEAVTGEDAYAQIRRRLLAPLALAHTDPSDRVQLPGLVPGFAGEGNPFGGDRMIRDGALVLNPQFEWGGGGFVSNAPDLARWVLAFCTGKAFPRAMWTEVATGVSAPDLGKDARSGLGIEIFATPAGTAYGHGGFFPGYVSHVKWYGRSQIGLAIQVNTSADDAFPRPVAAVLDDAALALEAIH